MAIKKAAEKQEAVQDVVQEEVKPTTRAKKAQPKQVDITRKVPVMNMSQASLHYSAKKGNGYLELDQYLDTDYMAIEDLQIMRNTARGMFTKGWLFIDDEEAVEFLNLKKEMDAIVQPDEFEEFFQLDTDTIADKMAKFSASTKESIYQALKKKVENGELSNFHTIKAIEASLDIEPTMSVLQ